MFFQEILEVASGGLFREIILLAKTGSQLNELLNMK
jgi:hypothetical protein